jgi:hypothetical protein
MERTDLTTSSREQSRGTSTRRHPCFQLQQRSQPAGNRPYHREGPVQWTTQRVRSEIVEFTVTGKFVSEFSIDNNIDGPFGIAIETLGHASQFAYLNDNKNTLTVWRLGSSNNQNEQ